MHNILGMLVLLVTSLIIGSPFYIIYYFVTKRSEKKNQERLAILVANENERKEAAKKIQEKFLLEKAGRIKQAKEQADENERKLLLEKAELIKKAHEQENENQRKLLLEKGMPISGSETFQNAIRKILEELAIKSPQRYVEAVTLLPKAEYTTQEGRFSGRSDGLFKLDGSDYGVLRWVFLHEVGHNVAYKENNDHSEEAANRYADMVTRELEG